MSLTKLLEGDSEGRKHFDLSHIGNPLPPSTAAAALLTLPPFWQNLRAVSQLLWSCVTFKCEAILKILPKWKVLVLFLNLKKKNPHILITWITSTKA